MVWSCFRVGHKSFVNTIKHNQTTTNNRHGSLTFFSNPHLHVMDHPKHVTKQFEPQPVATRTYPPAVDGQTTTNLDRHGSLTFFSNPRLHVLDHPKHVWMSTVDHPEYFWVNYLLTHQPPTKLIWTTTNPRVLESPTTHGRHHNLSSKHVWRLYSAGRWDSNLQ